MFTLTMRRDRAVPRDQSDLDPAGRANPAQASVGDVGLLQLLCAGAAAKSKCTIGREKTKNKGGQLVSMCTLIDSLRNGMRRTRNCRSRPAQCQRR